MATEWPRWWLWEGTSFATNRPTNIRHFTNNTCHSTACSVLYQIASPSKQQPHPRSACMRRTSTTASLSGDSFLLNSNWIRCLKRHLPWPAKNPEPSPSSSSTPSPSLREANDMQRPPRYVNFTALPINRAPPWVISWVKPVLARNGKRKKVLKSVSPQDTHWRRPPFQEITQGDNHPIEDLCKCCHETEVHPKNQP